MVSYLRIFLVSRIGVWYSDEMKLSSVPWDNLRPGLVVTTESPTDHFRGVIALIDAPLIWIAWDDGNRQSYNKAVLGFVTLLDEDTAAPQIDPSELLREREVPDAEGE